MYCHNGTDADRVIGAIDGTPGIENVWSADAVVKELEQPRDREGDVAVMGDKKTVIGGRQVDHDLSALKGTRLRTHGSLHEANVPFVISDPLNDTYAARGAAGGLRSHELFDFALNGVN